MPRRPKQLRGPTSSHSIKSDPANQKTPPPHAHTRWSCRRRPVYISYLSVSTAAVVGCYTLYNMGRRRTL
jgi:hypothetical protein